MALKGSTSRHCYVVGCTNGDYKLQKWRQAVCDVHQVCHDAPDCTCSPPFEYVIIIIIFMIITVFLFYFLLPEYILNSETLFCKTSCDENCVQPSFKLNLSKATRKKIISLFFFQNCGSHLVLFFGAWYFSWYNYDFQRFLWVCRQKVIKNVDMGELS